MPKKSLVLLSGLFLTVSVVLAQSPSTQTQPATHAAQGNVPGPAAYKIPDEALKQPNPEKPTAESIATGKRIYGYDCAMCHGVSGDGKGDLAGDMKLQLADLREAKSLAGKTDGELFYVIKNGKNDMPAEGSRAKPDQIWDMVNYIRSLAKSAKPQKLDAVGKPTG